MNKFLLITHAFPPFGGGGVQRMAKFATYLENNNWRATVVCPGANKDSWLDYERLDEVKHVEQIRVGYRNLKNDLILVRLFRKLYPVDSYYGWSQQVIKLLKQKDLSEYKVIFTSGPPQSVHLVGMMLARKIGMKWVADFRDHYTLGPEYKATGIKARIDRWFEDKIYKNAAAVIVNTNTNRNEVLEGFNPTKPGNIHTIYNGFDYNDLQRNGNIPIWKNEDGKHYLYLGGLRGDRIDGAFYRVLARAIEIEPALKDEIKIHIIGDHSRKGDLIATLGLSGVIDFSDPVAFNNVADFIEHADGCLTWQTPKPRYRGTIAGKVFDYIGMKKPVFSLGQDDGEIALILRENNVGISTNPVDTDKAAKDFIAFHHKVIEGYFDYSKARPGFPEKYNRVEQAQQLAEVFNSII